MTYRDPGGAPRPRARSRRPRRARARPSATARARAAERGYASQGRAVEHVARQQRRAAARPKPGDVQLGPRTREPQVHNYPRLQSRAQQRATAAHVRSVRRNTFGVGENPIETSRRAQRGAIAAFAELHASDPAKYERTVREHHMRKVAGVPVEKNLRKVAGETQHGIDEVTAATKKWTSRYSKAQHKAGLTQAGAAPDVSKLATEAMDLTANLPTSTYLTGAAALEAAKGRPARGKKLIHDFKATSALAAVSAGDFKEAAHRAKERPITTALELRGAAALGGRVAGAAARHAPIPGKGFRQKVRNAGSTERPNLRLYPDAKPGAGPEEGRTYSKDLTVKLAQKARERHIRRQGRDPHVDYGASMVPALPQRLGGREPGAPMRRKLVRRTDTRNFSQDRVARNRRQRAVQQVNKTLRRRHATGVQLAAEGTVRATGDLKQLRRDLRNRKLTLAKARQNLSDPERLKLNLKERKDIRELEALSDEKLSRVQAGAQEFARSQEEVQTRGRRVGLYDATSQSKRWMPYLQSHMRRQATEARKVPLTEAERTVAAKSLARRARRGQALPKGADIEARKAAMLRRQEKMRETAAGPVQEAVARVAAGDAPGMRVVGPRHPKGPDPTHLDVQLSRLGFKNPVRMVALSAKKVREGVRGGYGGLRRDPHSGRMAHTIYFNPTHGVGARNAALWHEIGHAHEVEQGRHFQPTTRMSAEEYRRHLPEENARAFADKHMDTDLWGPPSVQHMTVQRPKVGQAKGVTRADFGGYLRNYQRPRVHEPSRKFTPEEAMGVGKILERRQRRGQGTVQGVPEGGPAFITQRPGRNMGRAQAFPHPDSLSHERSGVGFATGTRGTGAEALRRQAAMAERTATAQEGFQLSVREFARPAGMDGARHADSFGEAAKTANLVNEKYGTSYVPVNMAAFREFGHRLKAKQEQGMPRGQTAEGELVREAAFDTWNAALSESGRGRWVLMPSEVVNRFREHANVGTFGPLHGATNLFKDVVLTSSSPFRWIGGNVTDLTMRTVLAGITPADIARGRRIVQTTAKQGLQGEQAAAAVGGGGLYHAADALSRGVRRTDEHVARTVASAPWRAWKGLVYGVEGYLEEIPQRGATGKAFRQSTGRQYAAPAPSPVRRASPEEFAQAVERTPNADGFLTRYDPKDYAGMRLHISPDGKSGFALRGNELVNLFSHPDAKLSGTEMLAEAERRGATRLDATAPPGGGLERFYGKRGWQVEREEPWDPQYGPPPSPGARVVYMKRDPAAQRAADMVMKTNLKSLLHLHDQQIDHFAKRLATDRALEARIQKATEDVIGRWGKVSPNMRRALVIAPFAQWLGAATRYTFVTLPVNHPIKTAILAGISEMTEEERKRLGLSYWLPRDKQAYDYQMGTLPLHQGSNKYGPVVKGIRTARMTSLGTAAGVPGNLSEFLLPQFAGALDAWNGQSFTGEQLTYPDWWPEPEKRRLPIPPDERMKIGLGALLESSVPFASAFRRSILEQGRPAEPWSTVLTPATRKKYDKDTKTYVENKGTTLGGILEWLSPYAPMSRVYTYETGKAIEEQGIAGEVLSRWSKLPRQSKGYGFGGGSQQPSNKDYGFGNRGLKQKKEGAYGF